MVPSIGLTMAAFSMYGLAEQPMPLEWAFNILSLLYIGLIDVQYTFDFDLDIFWILFLGSYCAI